MGKSCKVKPLSFEEVEKHVNEDRVPDFVIKSVNELLLEEFNGRSAVITQDAIINNIRRPEKYSDMDNRDFRKMLFDRHWLDFEPMYRKQGWSVEYDKPGLGEDYDAHFIFRKAKN